MKNRVLIKFLFINKKILPPIIIQTIIMAYFQTYFTNKWSLFITWSVILSMYVLFLDYKKLVNWNKKSSIHWLGQLLIFLILSFLLTYISILSVLVLGLILIQLYLFYILSTTGNEKSPFIKEILAKGKMSIEEQEGFIYKQKLNYTFPDDELDFAIIQRELTIQNIQQEQQELLKKIKDKELKITELIKEFENSSNFNYVRQLKSELNKYEEQKKLLSDKVIELIKEKQRTEETLKINKIKLEVQENINENLVNDIKKIQNDLIKNKQSIDQYELNKKKLIDEKDQLIAVLEESTSKVKELETEQTRLNEIIRENNKLKVDLSHTEDRLILLTQELEKYYNDKKILENELSKIHNDYNFFLVQFEKERDQYKIEIEQLKQDNEQLSNQKEEIDNNLNVVVMENAQNLYCLSRLEDSLKSLQNELDEAETLTKKQHSELLEQKTKLENEKKDIENLINANKEIEAKYRVGIDAITREYNQTKQKQQLLENDFRDIQDKYDQKEKFFIEQQSRLKKEIKSYKGNLEKSEEEKNRLIASTNSLKQQIDLKQKEITNHKIEIEKQKFKKQELESDLNEKISEIDNLTETIKEITVSSEKQKEELRNKEEELRVKKEELNKYKNDFKDLENTLRDKDSQINSSKIKLELKSNELEELNNEIYKQKDALSNKEREYEKLLEEKNNLEVQLEIINKNKQLISKLQSQNACRVVLDTNIFINYFQSKDNIKLKGENEIFNYEKLNLIRFVFCHRSQNELLKILARKIEDQNIFRENECLSIYMELYEIFSRSIIIETPEKLKPLSSDKSDQIFLELAVAVNAEYLITRDRKNGLLDIKKYQNTYIVEPEGFIKRFEKVKKGKSKKIS